MNAGIQAVSISASFWESAGYWASALVTLAVVLEFWEIFLAIRAGEGRKRVVETIALVLLVVGLIGEIWTAVEANKYNGLEVAAVQSKATAALYDATTAENVTKQAMERVINLERQEAPRTLTDDESVALVDLTWNFVRQKFFVAISSRDAETAEFARSILINLEDASWDSGNETSPPLLPILTVGVIVVLNQHEPATDETTNSAKILAKFLYDHGFSQTIGPDYDSRWASLGSIFIIVGEKILPQPENQAN